MTEANQGQDQQPAQKSVSRRDFFRVLTGVGTAAALAACRPTEAPPITTTAPATDVAPSRVPNATPTPRYEGQGNGGPLTEQELASPAYQEKALFVDKLKEGGIGGDNNFAIDSAKKSTGEKVFFVRQVNTGNPQTEGQILLYPRDRQYDTTTPEGLVKMMQEVASGEAKPLVASQGTLKDGWVTLNADTGAVERRVPDGTEQGKVVEVLRVDGTNWESAEVEKAVQQMEQAELAALGLTSGITFEGAFRGDAAPRKVQIATDIPGLTFGDTTDNTAYMTMIANAGIAIASYDEAKFEAKGIDTTGMPVRVEFRTIEEGKAVDQKTIMLRQLGTDGTIESGFMLGVQHTAADGAKVLPMYVGKAELDFPFERGFLWRTLAAYSFMELKANDPDYFTQLKQAGFRGELLTNLDETVINATRPQLDSPVLHGTYNGKAY